MRCEDLEEESIELMSYIWPGLRESCYMTDEKKNKCIKTDAFPMVQWDAILGIRWCG